MVKKKNGLKRFWKFRELHLMALPAVLALLVFSYLPMAGLVMAFQRLDLKKGIFSSPWVGLDNFKFLFATSDAWIITRNTVLYNVVFIVLGLFFSVLLALVMNELLWKRLSKTLQTMIIMPYFLSMVVVSMAVYAFLNPTNGYVNSLLKDLGMQTVDWYSVKEAWPFLLVFIHLWHSVGYSSIIYMAAISGIPSELYEAAALDGATKLQQVWNITLPNLRPIICINLIRSIGGMMYSDFGLFYTVPRDSGILYSVTNTLDTYIYRALSTLNNPGMSTAAGLYQAVVGLVLVLTANKIISAIDSDSAMF